jgi:hypothetical protein
MTLLLLRYSYVSGKGTRILKLVEVIEIGSLIIIRSRLQHDDDSTKVMQFRLDAW